MPIFLEGKKKNKARGIILMASEYITKFTNQNSMALARARTHTHTHTHTHKTRYTDQWKRIESPEINPSIYGSVQFSSIQSLSHV